MNPQPAPLTIEISSQVRFAAIHLSTGVYMQYAEYGDSAEETIVFLHGLSDSWFSFSPVLEYLSPNYRVLMPDQRGHGGSSQPESGYAIKDFANDVVAFMDALDLRHVTLIGHSMGSFIAQQVAVEAAGRVARLILVGSATKPRTRDLDEFGILLSTIEYPVPEQLARDFQTSTLFRQVTPKFLDQVISESMKLRAHVWRGTARDFLTNDTPAALERIQAPTLIVWGEQDVIWSRREQEILAAQIPNAELRAYALTGHALHWEQPEQFVRDLEAFIRRTT